MNNLKLKVSYNIKSLDLEKNVLACLLMGEHEFVDMLTIEDFALPKHQEIFQVIKKFTNQNKTPDLLTVSSSYKDANYLTELVSLLPSTSNIEQWISELKEYANLRRLQWVFVHGQNLIKEGADSNEILSLIYSETKHIETHSGEILTLDQIAEEMNDQESYEKLFISEYSTKLIDLDKAWHIHHGDLVILAGRPSMGKTALMLALAKNLAQQNIGVGLFSLEMSKEQLLARLVASESKGDMNFRAFSEGTVKISKLPIFINEKSSLTLSDAKSSMRKLSRYGVKWFFIDYLQIMNPPQADNRNLELGVITRNLKQYAREFNVVVVLLSQLSRAVEQRADKRPSLADLRDSGSIEQDADTVIFLYRPSYYHEGKNEEIDGNFLPNDNLLELLIKKQRHFKTKNVWVNYDRNEQKIENLLSRDDGPPF
jgi:replicative DNA helicase